MTKKANNNNNSAARDGGAAPASTSGSSAASTSTTSGGPHQQVTFTPKRKHRTSKSKEDLARATLEKIAPFADVLAPHEHHQHEPRSPEGTLPLTQPTATATTSVTTPADASAATDGKPAAKKRPPPRPIDPNLNGPNDRMALLPLTLILLATLATLWQCIPSTRYWAPPVDPTATFTGFEWPGRGVVGGAGGWSDDGAGPITYAPLMGVGGVTPGTRSFWPYIGRRQAIAQIRAVLALHPLAVVAGPTGAGRTSLVAQYVDSTRNEEATDVSRSSAASQVAGPTSEYSVILWLDSSSRASLLQQFTSLHAYLRLHTMQFDAASILANVHAWLYKQEGRWLIIFDNVSPDLSKADLQQYVPLRGGHTIVVVTTSSFATGAKSQQQLQQGFDLSAQECIRLAPLPIKAASKLLDYVNPRSADADAKVRKSLLAAFAPHTAGLVAAGLYLKRHQTTVDLEQLVALLMPSNTGTASDDITIVQPLLALILRDCAASLREVHGSRVVQDVLGAMLRAVSSTNRTISASAPNAFLAALITHPSTPADAAAIEVDAVVRTLSFYGLVSQHATSMGGIAEIQVYLAPWFVRELRHATVRGAFGTSGDTYFVLSPGATASTSLSWPAMHAYLTATAFVEPLVQALGIASASAYSVPTASVVSATPHAIPPLRRPYELYLSALATIAEDESISPIVTVDTRRIMRAILRAYGGAGDVQSQEDRGAEIARGAAVLPNLAAILFASAASSVPTSDEFSAVVLYGCYQLDILRDTDQALRAFRRALDLAQALAVDVPRIANPFSNGRLVSENGLNASPANTTLVAAQHAVLATTELAGDARLAGALALLGVVVTCSQEGGDGSATTTSLDARLALDVALNYHLLALEVRKGALGDKKQHVALNAHLSQVAHVRALQRDLEGAKRTYAESLEADEALSLTPLDEKARRKILQWRGKPNADPMYRARLLHQLRFVRDLSVLAHEEAVLMYYANALDLHKKAYHLEVELYGTDSLGAAARWMHMAHAHAAAQQAKEAYEFYESSLEYHKSITAHFVQPSSDLRLVAAQMYSGKGHNALGRGRAGKRAFEAALDGTLLAVGGETHVTRVKPLLELLGDTSYALSAYQDAMGFYRRILTMSQALLGEVHKETQQWKEKVLELYRVVQQKNEEHRRKQQLMQQEQLRRLQEQRAKDADAERRKAQQGSKSKQDL